MAKTRKRFFHTCPVFFLCLVQVFVLVLSLVAKGESGYSIGPGGGGAIMHPAINPHDANHIFLACDMGSSFISRDGGKTFQNHNFGSAGANDIARAFFSPHDRNVMYVGGGTISSTGGIFYSSGVLYVSHDQGKHFKAIWPPEERFVGIFNNSPYYQYTVGFFPSGYDQLRRDLEFEHSAHQR